MLADAQQSNQKQHNKEVDTLRARSNKHMNEAAQWKRQAARTKAALRETTAKLEKAERKLQREAEQKKALEQQVADLRSQYKRAHEQELKFGWALANLSVKDQRWLRRLASTPPPNRDRCWGGFCMDLDSEAATGTPIGSG